MSRNHSRNHSHHRNVPMNVQRSNGNLLVNAACNLLASGNPTRQIAGIAVGTIAVSGLAINAISKLNR